jgi:hypothetical protein
MLKSKGLAAPEAAKPSLSTEELLLLLLPSI